MKTKLWNDNKHVFKQSYRGVDYVIPPQGYIELQEDEAHMLCCAYYAPDLDGGGTPKPESYKMLRMENQSKIAVNPYQCAACGDSHVDAEELKAHVEAQRRAGDAKHEAIELPKGDISSEVEDLRAELAEIKSLLAAKKPGRPKKDVREDIQK